MRRALLLLLTLLVAGVVYVIGWSSLLTVTSFEIATTDPKNVALIEDELRRSGVEVNVGDPLARINPRAIERSLKKQPWIGEVRLDRKWIGGAVTIEVSERIPKFRVQEVIRRSELVIAPNPTRFMTSEGTLFELPGDLAMQYQDLPEMEIRSESVEARRDAAQLFDQIDTAFPTERIIVTAISTFITESEIPVLDLRDDGKGRQIKITWGEFDRVEAKMKVIQELLTLKANRSVARIDVSNPSLPIASNSDSQ